MTLSNTYEDFMREGWDAGISDTLLACVMPIDHSSISKRRREIGKSATCANLSRGMIYRLFTILGQPKYNILVHSLNPKRTKHNVKLWEKFPELYDYFMLLRNNLLDKIKAGVDENCQIFIEEEIGEVEDVEKVTEEVTEESINSSVKNDLFSQNYGFKNLKTESVESMLRNSVIIAIMQGNYEVADEILTILRVRFEN